MGRGRREKTFACACTVLACALLVGAHLAAAPGPSVEGSAPEPGPDYPGHAAGIRERVKGQGFTVVIEPPFVVVGDEPAHLVKRRSVKTVRWAANMLKKDFFRRDPEKVVDIWLFKDKASYEKNTRAFFGIDPHTPFGFCSSDGRSLIMNIGTGGGTLVHEMVHAFMKPNFPQCPAWFNEGLGSLYEQCREKEGRIYGMTNWRLRGLQEAIRAGKVPLFEKLLSTTDHEFYKKDRGTNYAQARYLCYYLQEQGLLAGYYRGFRDNREDDPTGYKTLKKALGEEDMRVFQKKWESFVLKLTFP